MKEWTLFLTQLEATYLPESIRCLKPEGRIIPIGFASGRIPSIPTNLLLVKNITICGLNMGLYFGWGPVDDRKNISQQWTV